MKRTIQFFLSILIFVNINLLYSQSPILNSCRQLVVVVTDSISANKGKLCYFERNSFDDDWVSINQNIPIVIGKNGFGLGKGLHSENSLNISPKVEGDSKSPAGVFNLSSVIGFSELDILKMPYLKLEEAIECIDDIDSDYYNQIIQTNEFDDKDWDSSEPMYLYKNAYEFGVVIDHNKNPITKGFGSCIFLHNWGKNKNPTAGCTALEPSKLKEIIYWLDYAKNPIIVQLPKAFYIEKIESWELPNLEMIFNK